MSRSEQADAGGKQVTPGIGMFGRPAGQQLAKTAASKTGEKASRARRPSITTVV
jgi:hypothetical protein